MGKRLPPVMYRGYVSDLAAELNRCIDVVAGSLSVWQRLLLRLRGWVRIARVRVVTPEGISGVEELCLARCPRCGALYIDYPHGYDGYLVCPRCGYRVYR